VLAFIFPVLRTARGLSSVQIGVLGSSTFIGFLFGALLAGTLGDLIGRRAVMMWALALYSAASLVSAAVDNWSSFFAARIVAGMGTGAESAIIAPYLAEFVARRFRGSFTGALVAIYCAQVPGYFSAAWFNERIGRQATIALLYAAWRRERAWARVRAERSGDHACGHLPVAFHERYLRGCLRLHGRGLPDGDPNHGAYTAEAISRAVRCGVRTIEHGNLIDLPTARLMAEKGVFAVPTLVTYEALASEGAQYGLPAESVAKIADVRDAGLGSLKTFQEAGVKMGWERSPRSPTTPAEPRVSHPGRDPGRPRGHRQRDRDRRRSAGHAR